MAFHESMLRRALLNLMQNALDAMPGGGTLIVAGRSTTTYVQLQVQDTGSGIPAHQLAQIFEPLYTTKPGGTGLGLYIVQQIAATHGGQVTVASVEGQGTTFTLTLPGSRRWRRRGHMGLHQGEAKHALARAVCLNRRGEIRDRSCENPRFRALGRNLVVTAILLWNLVSLERAMQA